MSLVELMVALGIMAAIAPMISASLSTMVRDTGRSRARVTAVQDLQIAQDWLVRDISRSSTAVLLAGGASAKLTWWDGTITTSCTYAVSGILLERQCTSGNIVVARNITNATFAVNGQEVSATLSSAPDGASGPTLTKSVTVFMRSD